ncbi:MAG TPA: hypothetical protein VMT63_03135 [Bacteroidales bacterium]|nr:hypothetical protein [Bacteroidales bacterium]
MKKYLVIIIPVLIIIILVIAVNTGSWHFRYDARTRGAASYDGSNIIVKDKPGSISKEALVLLLDKMKVADSSVNCRKISVSPDSVFSGNCITLIRKNRGPVILYSADRSVSARVWMALAQAGMKNIYILTDCPGNI